MKQTIRFRICLVLLLFVFCSLSSYFTVGQRVQSPMTFSGLRVANSFVGISIGLEATSFGVYWLINGTEVAVCSYNAGGSASASLSTSSYDNRASVSYSVTTYINLTLEINPLMLGDNDAVVDMVAVPFLNSLDSITLEVIPDCSPLMAAGVDPAIDVCGYNNTCTFGCLPGREGNAIATCQANGIYRLLTNTCRNVTCNTNHAQLPEHCATAPNYEIGFGESVNVTCSGGIGMLVCTGQDVLEFQSQFLVSTPTLLANVHKCVVDSAAPLSVEATGSNFTLEWTINNQAAAKCLLLSQSQLSCGTYGEYEKRINISSEYVDGHFLLTLTLESLSMSDNDTNVNLLANVAFAGQYVFPQKIYVLPGCNPLRSDSVKPNPEETCRVNTNCKFKCNRNFDGGATCMCQGNGTFVITNNNCLPELNTGSWIAIVVCLSVFGLVSGAVIEYFVLKHMQKSTNKQNPTPLQPVGNKP